jgi:cytoskeletal protein RodZ
MIFETKKVPLETLGEYIAEIRQQLGLNVAEVVEKTGIGEKYLLNLEGGQYHRLPPNVYVFGFLRKLAELYAIPIETLLSQYKKERGIIDQVAEKVVAPPTGWRSWRTRLVVTPKLLTLAGGLGLVFVALGYLVVSVFLINKTPSLKVFQPVSGSVVKDSVITVAGQADPGSIVAINGENVFVDPKGNFSTNLGVAAGQKELAITAKNKFGKQSTQDLSVMVESSSLTGSEQAMPQAAGLNLQLKFARPTTINVNRDGVDLSEETVPAGGVKNIQADQKIVLTTTDAGSISASLNGKDLGVLGRNKERLTIPFTADNNLLVKSDTSVPPKP